MEIELKARLLGPLLGQIEKKLDEMGAFEGEYEKADSYWLPAKGILPGFPAYGIRVRREQALSPTADEPARALVTVKNKDIVDGIEANEEREFGVSDAALFEELARDMGFCMARSKVKRGRVWLVREDGLNVRAELWQVRDLGHFLELEIIAEDAEAQAQERCRKALHALLERLGVSRECIEARPYLALLESPS